MTTAFIDDLAFDVPVFLHGISIAWGSAANQNREPGTENQEPRTRNREPGTKNQEPGTKNQELRTEN
jgi:hypothetical protein